MPDESCRNCGGILLEHSICAKCRMPSQFICRICGTVTLPQYHDQCFDDIKSVQKLQMVEV